MVERNIFNKTSFILEKYPSYSILDFGVTSNFNHEFLLNNPNTYKLYWSHSFYRGNLSYQEIIFESKDGMFFYFSNRGSLNSGAFPSYELRILYDVKDFNKLELLINYINKKNQKNDD